MIVLDEYKQQIQEQLGTLREAEQSIKPDALKAELKELEDQMGAADFWNDVDAANKVNQRAKMLQAKINRFEKLVSMGDDLETLVEMAEEEDDESLVEDLKKELSAFSEKVQALKLELLLKGPYDSCDAVLSLHAGAGGTEAQDWTEMLYRMYTRYCESRGWTVRELDLLDGDDAGVKSVTFEVSGENAYGYLKAEKGVHRLVRISPFDASGRRHTSFSSLDVTPIFDDDTADVKIDPDDLRVDTYRSSGAGGQHVNKTSSAIRITHLPTGIVVQCQNERSQIQNRETAMRMLRGKLIELQEREREQQMADIKGEMKKIEWGSQIRSYVFQPYTLVKDHRTGVETGNIQAVMDGALDPFISAYLVQS
ncbi:MAG: peptide chain release factor 2 [Eubacteriales bacterium]|nr:peptide chain release factor 2 [Eubacteriales bacterium]